MKVSQRFHNDTYAPGIATYGIEGKTGEQGLPGTSMFFTDYSFPDELPEFVQKITSRKLPLVTSDTILDRRYVNGDLFVTPAGMIYKLTDIEQMSLDSANGTIENVSKYLEHVGQFSTTDSPFKDTNVLMNKSLTITDSQSQSAVTSALLSLVKGDNNDMNFINMQAVFENAANVDFNIKFDKGYNAYVLESKYPLLISSNVYVKMDDDIKQISGYSPVVTSDNTITDFVGTCKEYIYDTDASIFSYTKKDSSTLYYGCIYKVTLIDSKNQSGDNGDTLERYYSDSNIMVHFQNGTFQDFQNYRQTESIYYFRQNDDEDKLNDIITRVKYKELPQINVSLVYNVECFLTPNNKVISGLLEN